MRGKSKVGRVSDRGDEWGRRGKVQEEDWLEIFIVGGAYLLNVAKVALPKTARPQPTPSVLNWSSTLSTLSIAADTRGSKPPSEHPNKCHADSHMSPG